MENKICVYAICKNEEQFVEKWVKSMSEADAIVVLDTGSTDHTVEKLKALGVTVKTEIIDPWRFDVARNKSLEMVPDDCNILICTDLDEVLEPGWAKPLREKWIEGKHVRGIYKYSWSHLPDGSSGRIFRYDKIHSRGWHWGAPVHELLEDDVNNSNSYNYADTLDLFDEVHLHHYPDKTKSRGSYLPLLELRRKERPDDYYGLIYLAHEYVYRRHYEQAIDLLKEILERFKERANSVEEASCYLFIGDAYMSLADQISDEQTDKQDEKRAKLQSASGAYSKAISVEPTYREPYINLAKALYKMKDLDYAEFILKQGLKKSYRHYTWLERDISWSYEPWDLLCLVTYYNGKIKDSIMYAAKALTFEPNNERLLKNLDSCVSNYDMKELIK